MKFTNDIKFNKTPISNETIKITYKGNLFKDNSQEVYIVYGFGENWESTTEQKMDRRNYGFVTYITMQNYNTFNFCFRNSNHVWDNNNSFNYISTITSNSSVNEIEPLSVQEANSICTESIDNILNTINLSLDNTNTQTIETTGENSILDTLIEELYQEYTAKSQIIENTTQNTSLSNENSTTISEKDFDKFFEDTTETQEVSNIEYFSELTKLFDEIITNIENQNSSAYEPDIGKELDTIFENIFTENFKAETQDTEVYIPESDFIILNSATENENLNETFSDIVKNISKINEKTNSEVGNLNYDYSDFNEMFAFAQELNNKETKEVEEENIFDFSNLDFDFEINKNTQNTTITENAEENTYNFANPDFEVLQPTNSIEVTQETQSAIISNQFSDSFYDDEDITTHENYTNFQEIVDSITTELELEVEKAHLFKNEEISEKENQEFEAAVNEYAQYFDNLIDEIVSTSTSTLSTPVSTAQVIETENTTLAISQPSSSLDSSQTESTEISTDAVPNEYALYDYKSHSFFYMIKRRFKQVFSALFTKLPKLFGKDTQNENN